MSQPTSDEDRLLLEREALTLMEDAREAKDAGNTKLAGKLLAGARRLERWAVEGIPEEHR